ncbi:MAG: 30S ribosomal protein S6 [Spirochaetales bacterium]|nr:30S ribosomal protein S6 [Spirochaetales bacterium]
MERIARFFTATGRKKCAQNLDENFMVCYSACTSLTAAWSAVQFVHEEEQMRHYEVACVFRQEDDIFNRGKEMVKSELTGLGAVVTGEEDMGQRPLAYPVKRETRAHYLVFLADMEPAKARLIEDALKLKTELLKVMVVNKEK